MPSHIASPKRAQQIQDEIFRKMSADEKLALGSALWLLAKELAGDKFFFDIVQSTNSEDNK